ncbi:hypothetical protein ES708_30351 [subsurface metagenome]
MSFPNTILQQPLARVKSHNTSGDPGRDGHPGFALDPRSPSALAADLYLDGRFWATVQLPARSPLATLAQALSTQSYRRSWQLLAEQTHARPPAAGPGRQKGTLQ